MSKGTVKIGSKTKELTNRLKPGDIALINHPDLDAMGALGLAATGIEIVLNVADSITGRYPNLGPKLLLEKNIRIIDQLGEEILRLVEDNTSLEVKTNQVYQNSKLIATGRSLDLDIVLSIMEHAKSNIDFEVMKFVDNTVKYIEKEKQLLLSEFKMPRIKTSMTNKHVVVVVRGYNYQEDLRVISSYIDEVAPVLIGVDGGADALIEFRHQPDIIIGDMDSVSDKALGSGAEILVHAYTDGRCPGAKRLSNLNIPYKIFPAYGTSEDIALLLAYEMGAQLIIAVGLHSNLIDFLEKGRPGMASTFLTRMKIGSILVDAKGVSQLYTEKSGMLHIPLMLAALIPIIFLVSLATPWRGLVRLIWLQIRLFIGGII